MSPDGHFHRLMWGDVNSNKLITQLNVIGTRTVSKFKIDFTYESACIFYDQDDMCHRSYELYKGRSYYPEAFVNIKLPKPTHVNLYALDNESENIFGNWYYVTSNGEYQLTGGSGSHKYSIPIDDPTPAEKYNDYKPGNYVFRTNSGDYKVDMMGLAWLRLRPAYTDYYIEHFSDNLITQGVTCRKRPERLIFLCSDRYKREDKPYAVGIASTDHNSYFWENKDLTRPADYQFDIIWQNSFTTDHYPMLDKGTAIEGASGASNYINLWNALNTGSFTYGNKPFALCTNTSDYVCSSTLHSKDLINSHNDWRESGIGKEDGLVFYDAGGRFEPVSTSTYESTWHSRPYGPLYYVIYHPAQTTSDLVSKGTTKYECEIDSYFTSWFKKVSFGSY